MSDLNENPGLPTEQPGEPNPAVEEGQSEVEQAFFEYSLPDGSKKSYKSADELSQDMRRSYLQQADYSRKTQSHAEAVKAFEKEKENFQKQMEMFTLKQKEMMEFDNFLRRRPDAYNQLKKMVTAPMNPGDAEDLTKRYIEEALGPVKGELEEFKKWKENREFGDRRNAAFDSLSKKYSDFDRKTIEENLASLQDGDMELILDTIYHANKGRSLTPEQVEKGVIEKLRKKQSAVLPGSGTPAKSAGFKDVNEAKAAALRDVHLTD